MSDLEWDAEDFVPPPPAVTVSDKWDGEDEDVEIKESWDDEDDEDGEKKQNVDTTGLPTKPKKKKLHEILAEKEKRKQEEMERRRKEAELERKNQSPEAQLEEKLRLQKIQEDSDLALATDMLGLKNSKPEPTPLDGFILDSKDELEDFRKALVDKIRNTDRLEKRTFYVTFVEDLSRELCVNMELEDVKRVTSVLNALYNEKVKASKPTKGKKKGAGKAKLNPGQGAIADNIDTNYDYGEYDDFI